MTQQPVRKGDLQLDPLPQLVVWHAAQLALDVPHHTAGIAFQSPQGLARPLELPRMAT
jgi:hypothetical protein